MNRTVVYAGLITLIQASVQVVMTALAIAQYFCVIDFLRQFKLLIFIKILYYHNPSSCGTLVNIGEAVDEISNQAVVLITKEALTVTRTLYINSVSLVLGVLWSISSGIMMKGGGENRSILWPWVMTTVAVCTLDLIASVIFINDTFYTKTLSDMMSYIGATASGVRNITIDTRLVSWSIVVLYSRFIILFLINVTLVIIVVLNRISNQIPKKSLSEEAAESPKSESSLNDSSIVLDMRTPSLPREQKIPRAWYNRNSKRFFQSNLSLESVPAKEVIPQTDILTLPQRLEEVRKEQERERIPEETQQSIDLEEAGPSGVSQKEAEPLPGTSRKMTAVDIPGQLPWTYITLSERKSDEVPPLPLPENSLVKKRKAAILRSLSSLTSFTQKKTTASETPSTYKWEQPARPAVNAKIYVIANILIDYYHKFLRRENSNTNRLHYIKKPPLPFVHRKYMKC